jgi:hypothetical protein
MHATKKSMLSVLTVPRRLVSLATARAARIPIWARERQMVPGKAAVYIMLLAVAALLGAGTSASAQVTPSADAYTNSADPTTNFGPSPLLDVVGASQISYIQFNLASIPAGSSVTDATLKLYVNAVGTAGSFNVDYVNGTWSENTITFDLAPALGNTIASSVPVTAADKNQYILINVTAAVQAWLDGSQSNDGIALVANSKFSASFDSKENTGTSHPAELDIVFTSGAGTITGVTTATGSGLSGGGTTGTLSLSLTNGCSSTQILQWNGSGWVCSSAGTGTITDVTAGTGLTGGGASGKVTLNVNTASVPLLTSANSFTQSQSIVGNLNLPNTIATTIGVVEIGPTPFLHNYGVSGSYNTFAGGAGNFTNTGSQVVGVGYGALNKETTGVSNTAVGQYGLQNATTGDYNTSIGAISGLTVDQSAMTGSYNTFLGGGTALSTGTLSNATAVGFQSEVGESNALVLGCVSGTNGCTANTNVGIGTTTPQQLLDVTSGNAIVRGDNNFQSSGQVANLYLGDMNHSLQAVNATGINLWTFNESQPVQFTESVPDIWVGAILYYDLPSGSNNVQTLTGALDKVQQLRGVSYDSQDEGRQDIGLVGAEVAAVVPEVVAWDKDKQKVKAVDYTRLTPLLIEAIKEQQQLIQKQQAQLKAEDVAAKIQQAQLNDLTVQMKTVQTALKMNGQTNSPVLASNTQPAN